MTPVGIRCRCDANPQEGRGRPRRLHQEIIATSSGPGRPADTPSSRTILSPRPLPAAPAPSAVRRSQSYAHHPTFRSASMRRATLRPHSKHDSARGGQPAAARPRATRTPRPIISARGRRPRPRITRDRPASPGASADADDQQRAPRPRRACGRAEHTEIMVRTPRSGSEPDRVERQKRSAPLPLNMIGTIEEAIAASRQSRPRRPLPGTTAPGA